MHDFDAVSALYKPLSVMRFRHNFSVALHRDFGKRIALVLQIRCKREFFFVDAFVSVDNNQAVHLPLLTKNARRKFIPMVVYPFVRLHSVYKHILFLHGCQGRKGFLSVQNNSDGGMRENRRRESAYKNMVQKHIAAKYLA